MFLTKIDRLGIRMPYALFKIYQDLPGAPVSSSV